MHKTLIGKNGYLFLQNDSAKELEVHTQNLCLVDPNFYKKYEAIKDKFLLILFPNKCLVYSEHLPDTYHIQYRPGFDLYSEYLKNHIIDGLPILKNSDTFYKTDTHINTKGALLIYNIFIDKINELFNLNIVKQEYTLVKQEYESLTTIGLEIGDLTWKNNLGNQYLDTTNDIFYYIQDNEQLFCKYIFFNDSKLRILNNTLIDETSLYLNRILDWHISSNNILYIKNDDKKYKVVIFYDSFLCSTMQLYLTLFHELYFIKSIFDENKINEINPDYVFEFRCERFLV